MPESLEPSFILFSDILFDTLLSSSWQPRPERQVRCQSKEGKVLARIPQRRQAAVDVFLDRHAAVPQIVVDEPALKNREYCQVDEEGEAYLTPKDVI